MSLVPAFDIGVWNAWILMIWLVIAFFLVPLNIIPKGREEGSDFTAELSKTQKCAIRSIHVIYLLSIVYSLFIPLRLGAAWFYAGLPIYLIGLALYALVWVGFATTPPDKLVTRGVSLFKESNASLSSCDISGSRHSHSFLGLLAACGHIHGCADFMGECRRTALPQLLRRRLS